MKVDGRLPKLTLLSAVVTIGATSCMYPQPNPGMAPIAVATLPRVESPTHSATQPAHLPGLHNVVAYAPGLYSGAVPEGEAAFATLAALGVRTIISVDGAQPEVELAQKHGLRYVHLPIGYDGMDETRALELARAAYNLPGPVYIHCHHGKHRSAGATASVAVQLGLLSNEQAIARMKVSGTSPSYAGLYQCARVARPASPQLLSSGGTFPERWSTTGIVQAMVEIDVLYEQLRRIEKAGWRVPADHPDLVPAAIAGRMADLFRNLPEDASVKAHPAEMVQWLGVDAGRVGQLEDAIIRGEAPERLSTLFKPIGQSCLDCHVKYRN